MAMTVAPERLVLSAKFREPVSIFHTYTPHTHTQTHINYQTKCASLSHDQTSHTHLNLAVPAPDGNILVPHVHAPHGRGRSFSDL